MSDSTERRILSLSTMSSSLLAVSLTLPRVVGAQIGFASPDGPSLLFLVVFGISTMLAVWSAWATARRFGALGFNHRTVGILPLLLVVVSAAVVYWRQ